MKTNPFKAFITYGMAVGLLAKLNNSELAQEKMELRASEDPTGATWGTMGFVSPDGSGDFAVPMAGTRAVMVSVQINDRILPGKVRDEHLKKRLADLYQQSGRAADKKEFAQLRDEVEAELLPKSHIRRTVVPVLVYEDRLVLFTSSAKRAADIAALLWALCNDFGFHPKMLPASAKDSVGSWLTALAIGDDESDSPFVPMDSGVLRSANDVIKSVVRIKDKDIEASDIQALLVDGGYSVAELGVSVMEGVQDGLAGVAGVTFTITDKLVVKGMKFPDLTIRAAIGEAGKGDGDDEVAKVEFQGMAHLVAESVSLILGSIFAAVGGEDRAIYDEDDEL